MADVIKRHKEKFTWIILFICLLIFIGLVEDIFEFKILQMDIAGYQFILEYIISDFWTPIMKVITWFGGFYGIIIITILLLVFIKDYKTKIMITLNLLIITLFNQSLKFIIQRPRPTENPLISENGYSFPSGHSIGMIGIIFNLISARFILPSAI